MAGLRTVHFEVEEALAGSPERALRIRGEKYLVFARQVGPRIVESGGPCAPVVLEQDAGAVLAALRRRKTEALGARLSLRLRDTEFADLNGVKLQLRREGEARTLVTGAEGRAEVGGLKAGLWRLELADGRYE